MITDEMRDAIRGELLALISRKRERPLTRRQRLWEFVNSNFVMWLLASVLVGGATYIYSAVKENRTARFDNEQRIFLIGDELFYRIQKTSERGVVSDEYRFQAAMLKLRSQSHSESQLKGMMPLGAWLAHRSIIEPTTLFTDFSQASTFALAAQVRSLAMDTWAEQNYDALYQTLAVALAHYNRYKELENFSRSYKLDDPKKAEFIDAWLGRLNDGMSVAMQRASRVITFRDFQFPVDEHVEWAEAERNAMHEWLRRFANGTFDVPTKPEYHNQVYNAEP